MSRKKRRHQQSKPSQRTAPAGLTQAEVAAQHTLRWRGWVFTILFGVATFAALAYFAFRVVPPPAPALDLGTSAPSAPPAGFVGSQACATCHAREYETWTGSQHAAAMQKATAHTVLGDFGGSQFAYADVSSTFFKRDGTFFAHTDGPDGQPTDYAVQYTFGVAPLQQYLLALPGGRLQALSIAWDTRPESEGGGRWFHLYPDERITHTDELHWSGRQQNWNTQCADCHSTDVRKRYAPETDAYATTWSEINVACEACHGPGSDHVGWAQDAKQGRPRNAARKGLAVAFDARKGVAWTINADTGNATRSRPRDTDAEIEVCAQCHARRSQIAEGYTAGRPFLDHYLPAVLTPGLYHPDGQQRDEVYNYGSFLQSKMYRQGVTCSDCHDPHSQTLRRPGNAVCAQCHAPAKYDAKAHHFHRPGTPGGECAACHLPPSTYMVIDPRHDHSLRVPRPDRSVALGVPNACNDCHRDQTPAWAAEQVRAWYGRDAAGAQGFAESFARAEQGDPRAAAALVAIANDAAQSPIVRASALARLAQLPAPVTLDVARAGVRDAAPLVRHAALGLAEWLPPNERPALVAPLLEDPVRAVRIEAAQVLAAASGAALAVKDRAAFARAAEEYIASQRMQAERPEYRTNLGTFFAQQGRFAEAEAEFRAALALDRRWVPAYVNAADLYRLQERDEDSLRVLREGLTAAADNASLQHALGLTLVRLGQLPQAVAAIERAVQLEPESARFAYVYAVALHSSGRVREAIEALEEGRARHPDDRELLLALAAFQRDTGTLVDALKNAEHLAELFPGDAEVQGLVRELRATGAR